MITQWRSGATDPGHLSLGKLTHQCQLFTFWASGLSSTIHLGSASSGLAISKTKPSGKWLVGRHDKNVNKALWIRVDGH